MQNNTSQRMLKFAVAPLLLLLIPLVAMQFTAEVDWSLFDFVIMGALIFIIGSGFVFATRNTATVKGKLITGAIFLFIFVLVWAELAVGVFGSPFAGS
jgi:hypothetical protein